MDAVSAEVRVCRKCRLWRTAKNPVPGEGSVHAALMFIGEAPGNQEDATGRPFIGRAGRLLTTLLAGVDLTREEVFIGNIIKHRPPENRVPRSDEIKACTPYLDRQIQIIKPRIIVPLGQHPARYILSKTNAEFGNISGIRGKTFRAQLSGLSVTVIPTFHPAAALYNPKYRACIEEDFQKIKTEI